MNKSRDIEYEMSRFEAEITKLTPAGGAAIISAPPVNNFTIKTIETPAPALQPFRMMLPTSFSFQTPQIPVAPYLVPPTMPINTFKPLVSSTSASSSSAATSIIPSKLISSEQSSVASTSSGTKRDASGAVKSVPTTAAAAATAVAAASFETDKKKAKDAKDKRNKNKKIVRAAGGQVWEDESLLEWNPDDFRLFCGDLGNEVTDESLTRAFQKYPSFQKAKVIRDKRTSKTKGYGFVSFKDSSDFIKAMREMDGKYVGNRPIKLRKSNWQDRNLDNVRRKELEKQKMGLR